MTNEIKITDDTKTTQEIGKQIGYAIARDAIADDQPQEWTDIDPQDLIAAGVDPQDAAAVAVAKEAYEAYIAFSEIFSHDPTFDGGCENARHDIIRDWLTCGFTADSVGDWTDSGCWHASTAMDLRAAGFRPGRDKLEWPRNGGDYDGDTMYALCNGDVGLEDLTW